jgi:surfactin synthase thioesterase subunit
VQKTSSRWILRPNRNPGAASRLFCFPFAGGGASQFRSWASLLAPHGLEVCGVQLPGRENRLDEALITHMDQIVEELASVVDLQSDIPFYFFGHSLGALVAFALAHALCRKQLAKPRGVIVSAARAAHVPRHGKHLHSLADEALIEEVRLRYDGIALQHLSDPELRAMVVPILRADFQIFETYACRGEPPLDIPILAFGGAADKHVSAQDLERWAELTRCSFEVRMFPGGHFFLGPCRAEVLAEIERSITSWSRFEQ